MRHLGSQQQALTARRGHEAISQLEAVGSEEENIVCDLAMRRMSGLELYEKINTRWPGRPSELEQRCYRKPVEIPELLEDVHTLVASRRGQPPNKS